MIRGNQPSEKESTVDERFMAEALRLARKGEGRVSPNPMVGAVLVLDGNIISRGYHRRFGACHAEVEALEGVRDDLSKATLYVTLEPCCYRGKTPPCTELIVKRGVKRVVMGVMDSNPKVKGRGIKILQRSGVEVRVGVMEEACRDLNRIFFYWMEHGKPWVTLKWAQSLDGKIGTSAGHSQWITGPGSRRRAHRLRATHDAVLVGISTVLKDDPELTVRYLRGRDPIRVIVDTRLRIPFHSRVMKDLTKGRETWVATANTNIPGRIRTLERQGARILQCPTDHGGRVDLTHLLGQLAQAGISSLLVEGGGKILTSFVKMGTFQRLVCFIAPIILGKGVDALEDLGISRVDEALSFATWRVMKSGEDVVVDALLDPSSCGYMSSNRRQ